jgi:hypothetical protein
MTRKVFEVFFCAVLSVVAFGQNATTSVRGTIADPTGAFVQGATVTLTNTTMQVSQGQKVGKTANITSSTFDPRRIRSRLSLLVLESWSNKLNRS